LEHASDSEVPGPRTDAAFVGLVAACSVALHVSGLGFYSDDWDLLSVFRFSADQSIGGLYRALAPEAQMAMRPGQKLLDVLLYRNFGLDPLGYHLFNAAVLIANGVLFLLVLRELGISRRLSAAAAIIYSLLPHYSTDRVWYASIQAPFSVTMYLLSLVAGLRSLEGGAGRAWSWRLLSLASLAASTLAYEVALPLFVLNAWLLWSETRRRGAGTRASLATRVFVGLTAIGPIAAAGFKAVTTTRLSRGPSLGYVTAAARQLAWINLWVYGVAAPRTVWIALRHASALTLGAAGILAVAIYAIVRRLPSSPNDGLPGSHRWFRLIGAGVGVFLLGYVVFLSTTSGFSATGPNNRTAIVGALGIALVFVGAAGWISDRLPPSWRDRGFAALVAACGTGGFVANAMLLTSWVTAYRQQEAILATIHQSLATIPQRTTVILDGVCPYVGPAIVFESGWDLQGALRLLYRDTTLQADVVTPNLRVEHDGLHAVLYGEDSRYPYQRLLLFNVRGPSSDSIPNDEAARAYFARVNPDRSNGCPPGRAGHGVRVF